MAMLMQLLPRHLACNGGGSPEPSARTVFLTRPSCVTFSDDMTACMIVCGPARMLMQTGQTLLLSSLGPLAVKGGDLRAAAAADPCCAAQLGACTRHWLISAS